MHSRRIAALGALGVALAMCVASAAGQPSTAPPAGIVPASTTLDAVLAHHRSAAGRLPATKVYTRQERWSLSRGALSGTLDAVSDGSNEREDETLGPSTVARGTFQGRSWRMNANGQVAFGAGIHRQSEVNAAAVRALAHPGVTLLGQVTDPFEAYVVKVDPPEGRLEYRFYDKTTYLIDRVETVEDGRRITTVNTDYRTTDGLTEPWHVRVTDGFASNDEDRVLQTLQIGGSVAAALVAVPTSAPPLFAPPPTPTHVPVEIDSDQIIVRATMGKHKVDFVLDSGSSDISIDKNVVEALGIKEYGRYTSQTAGTYAASDVILPKVSIGSLVLENVHATSLPFFEFTDKGTPVAGLLGYDFIRNAVWHVDYVDGTLEVIDPQTFTPPPGAQAFDVTFDDFTPMLTVSIGGAVGPTFIVDTGASRSTLFSRFSDAHPREVADRGLGEKFEAAFPFISHFSGVGGLVEYRPVQAGPLVLGPWTFPKWLFFVTQNAPAFEFEDYDGLIGQDLLRNFDLYLDYPHAKLYLIPNDRFRQRWPS
jgi:hypothetical protein